ncbi:hypothetical protein SCHPADRAFT_1000874 [Schizopora paradoxa]|uniref:Uncharacterized protein n=1 Tax=Schizopora paradoxa TaxID=27342 RepID=A0A0H2RG57_9AGAM|nr:hypothetical protein SCHPADRAFT_1000874 [Schizopora paradoxa]
MASTLGEPYTLASYSLSDQKPKGKAGAYEGLTFASHCSSSKNEDGLVTAAIQGDGVHVLNLTDMHPVSSHNLGPTTLFPTNPITVLCEEDGQTFRRTYAVMRRASGVKGEDAERTVWSWKEKASENLAVSQERTTVTIPIEAATLLASNALPSSLVFASRQGKVIRTDLNCKVANEWSPPEGVIFDKAILLPRRDCKFIQAESFSGGAALVLIYTSKDSTQLQLLSFGLEGEMAVHKPLKVLGNLKKGANVVDATCDVSGYLSVLTSDFSWSTFRLELSNGELALRTSVGVLHLRGFKPSPTRRLKGNFTAHSISALSLGSSFVLVAGETDSDAPEIALLLWDIQYGILLSQQTLPIPSPVDVDDAANTPYVPLQLVPATTTQALLLISPSVFPKAAPSKTKLKFSVLVVPYSVPPSSTIACALGKGSTGLRWLVSGKTHREPDSKVEAMLQGVQNAIEEEKPAEADAVFFGWISAESARRKQKGKQPQGQVDDENMDNVDISSAFTHSVTSRLVQSSLPVDAKPRTPYSPKILRYLLERGLVSNSMLNCGLLPALCLRSDWESIRMCFSHVGNLPELDLMRTLQVALKSGSPPSDDAMSVDKSPSEPQTTISTSTFLAGCMVYPYSPSPLRTALRTIFSEGEDLLTLLRIIVDWLDEVVKKDFHLEEDFDTEHDASPVKKQHKRSQPHAITEPPPLENIITFLLALLDSTFLTLLQHPPSHPLLRRIFEEQIGSQIAFNDDLEALRGTLQPFAKSHAAAITDARLGRTGNKKNMDHQEDWRKRRRRIHEQTEMALGPYQVEELVF